MSVFSEINLRVYKNTTVILLLKKIAKERSQANLLKSSKLLNLSGTFMRIPCCGILAEDMLRLCYGPFP